MAAYHNENELRASSSGFMWGNLVFTTYKTGCLRKILIQSRAVQAGIQQMYSDVGAMNEKRHEECLIDSGKRYLREYEFKTPLVLKGLVTGVTLSGHVDFVYIDDNDKPYALDELKSMTSKNQRSVVIKGGNYLIENLAQTINYMVNLKVLQGRLIYTFYDVKKNKDKAAPAEYFVADERIFNIVIDDYGRIIVDGEPTRWTVYDQLAHRMAAARTISTGEVTQRPHLWDAAFGSPCAYCPFSKACDKWDLGEIESTDAFVDYAKASLIKE